jgi:hypothetical protein
MRWPPRSASGRCCPDSDYFDIAKAVSHQPATGGRAAPSVRHALNSQGGDPIRDAVRACW